MNWGAVVGSEVDAVVDELRGLWPCSQVRCCEVLDERGVVAVLVFAGSGRLIVAARAVELVPVDWGLGEVGLADCVGVLPRGAVPTVAEVAAGLEVVR